MKQVWRNCHAATMADGRYSTIERAALVTDGARIAWIGPEDALPRIDAGHDHDLGGAWVTPGLIDCHTHLVFGGNRSQEFEQRLQGVDYAVIAAQGGGIASTVRATREATEAQLYASARQRALHLLRDGVTTLEIKSGYGLDLPNERKMLRVARRLGQTLPLTVRATCLAAHALPPEFAGRADDYIDEVARRMLPVLAAEGLVTIEPRRGASVSVLSDAVAYDMVEVRATLEGLNAKLAAQRRDDKTVERLQAFLREGTEAARSEQLDKFLALNSQFHEMLATIGGNVVLTDLMRSLRDRTALLFAPSNMHRAKQNWDEHSQILNAVIAGNGDLAALLASQHVHNAAKAYTETRQAHSSAA